MEVEVFRAIEAQINEQVKDINGNQVINFIHMWNSQVEAANSQDENGAPLYNIWFPALFVEYADPTEIDQLGNGVQIYDPLDIRIHIVHTELDSMNGEMEQNFNVMALKQQVFQALQGFEPAGCVAFTRMFEERDYSHNNVYHYVQTYRTNYVDTTMSRPVNGIEVGPEADPPTTIRLDVQDQFVTEIDTEI